jgi:hypothetical protein
MTTADETAVTEIRDRLAAAGTSWFLTVDGAGRCVQINLWALAALVNAIVTEKAADQVAYWQREADWLDRAVRIALNVPRVGGSTVEWAAQIRNERDEFAAESEHRETEILEVLAQRDQAATRVTELETALARAGESR